MAGRLPTVSRRSFVRGLASIGGLGAASCALATLGMMGPGALAAGATTAPLPAGSLAGKRVVVIGAGLAGLCTALRLARAGADVEILEATERSGGRSLTLRHGDTYREWDWNSPTTMRFEAVGGVAPDDPSLYLNAGPGRIPHHHARVIDYCGEFGVALQPYIFASASNLMQNDKWNGGEPVQLRRLTHDLRGHLAELLAKANRSGRLDGLIDPTEEDALIGMLVQFGQLDAAHAELVYSGAALASTNPRAGYRIEPGSVAQPGAPWSTLSLEEILASDFWTSEMFNSANYFWQSTLMEPTGGMDMIVRGFLNAPVPGTEAGATVRGLVRTGEPVRRIDIDGDKVIVTSRSGPRPTADFVVATVPPPLLARIEGSFLDGGVRQILSSVEMYPACKVGLQSRSRFWEEENEIYGGISWTKDIISQIWYPSYGFNAPTGVLTAAYNRGAEAAEFQELTREERVAAALQGGEKLHPGFRDKVFAENGVTIAWAKMPYQAGGWANDTSYSAPDTFREMANANPIGRHVVLAGDWFSYWPGWQEGALDSAHQATDLLARAALERG